jgi:DNA-binding response OmpR family regulator
MRVLLVEDEFRMGRFVEKGLKEHGFSVSWARTAAAARDILSEASFDIVVLDLGLPDGDGLDLLREWRECGFSEPVLVLSARDSVNDRVTGLNLGADDYLPKPFSFEELMARLHSQIRRSGTDKRSILEHRMIRLDILGRTATFCGQPVELTNREFALLELLMRNRGRVLSRTQISDRVWDAQFDMQTNLIDVYIRRLRKLFEVDGEEPLIKTVRGVGYMLV